MPFFGCCPHKNKRPEQVGAFVGLAFSAFSHSLFGRSFFVWRLAGRGVAVEQFANHQGAESTELMNRQDGIAVFAFQRL